MMESPVESDGESTIAPSMDDVENPVGALRILRKRHISQGNYRQIFDTVIIASNLGILRSVEFGAAKLLLV